MHNQQSAHDRGGPDAETRVHAMQTAHIPQEVRSTRMVRELLTASEVQSILHVDRSTVYRMAESGRLPAIRVGKQWRFPADEILALVSEAPTSTGPTDSASPAGGADAYSADSPSSTASGQPPRVDLNTRAAAAVVEVAADLLGVMMVVTDMDGRPVTSIANPCPWFVTHGHDPEVMAACSAHWHDLANDNNFEPSFELGPAGFECARAFLRAGRELVGMVLVGGVCPPDQQDPQLHNLDHDQRQRILAALPRIATAISRQAPTLAGASMEESL
jgi:excisionase family DNA binding protein